MLTTRMTADNPLVEVVAAEVAAVADASEVVIEGVEVDVSVAAVEEGADVEEAEVEVVPCIRNPVGSLISLVRR